MKNVIQIVKRNEDSSGKGNISLDEKAFKRVLKDANAHKNTVAVISICGEYGKGKSLLANFILQYLKNEGYSKNDNSWLEEVSPDSIENDEPGIFLYQDVIRIGEIAVLIMQVQGKFSLENGVFSEIFALGTLLSSVQIINLRTQLQGRDVLFLEKYLDYASKIGAEVKMRGVMQVALKILIRDWPYPKDNDFGYPGGEKYIDYALQSSMFDGIDDTMFFHQRLKQIFKTISCFLMPHPGLAVRTRKGATVDDLDETFKNFVKLFIGQFVAPNMIDIKRITVGGTTKNLSGELLLEHAHNCIKEICRQPTSLEQKEGGRLSISIIADAPEKPPRLIRAGSIKEHSTVSILDLKNEQVTLVGDMFEKILNQPEIGDKPIAVISIAGTFRKGKSFIMNFFIRYMRNRGYLQENDEWMGDDDCLVDDGFGWKSGVNPHTQGIMMYTEPFIVDTPNGEVALLFMDTQGLFDSSTGKEENMMIFAFNTIISSVQILNISMNLQESDLEFLQLFTEYARTIKNESSDSQFLQSLKFLIRDWQFTDDHEHGIEGGKEYLESYMATHNKNDELKSVREFISSKYQSIGCFLMPHPGFKLLKRGVKTQLKDLEEEFRWQLTPLAASILHPKNLVVKKFCKKPMNARALYASTIKFSEAIANGNLPNLTVMMDVMAKASNNELRKECLDYYTKIMKESAKTPLSDEEFQKLHDITKEKAIKTFFTGKEFGGAANQKKAVKNVSEEIDNARFGVLARRDHTTAVENLEENMDYMRVITEYRRLMKSISDKPINPNDFDEFEEECWRKAKQEKNLLDVPKQVLANMESSRHDFASLFRKDNSEKYGLVVDRLRMPGNYYEITSTSEAQSDLPNKVVEKIADTISDEVQEAFKKFEEAVTKNKSLSDRGKSELMYKFAREGFEDSVSTRKGCINREGSGHFTQYIQLFESMAAEKEPSKIEPDEKVLSSIRIRRVVNDCLKQFDEQTKQYSYVFVSKNQLSSLLNERRAKAMERYFRDGSQNVTKETLETHRKDLIASLNEKIRVAEQENERNRIHLNLQKEEMEKRIIKMYHSKMDYILKTGYIVEATLKEFHRNLIEDLKSEISADELPFYFTKEAEDHIFGSFKNKILRKLESLYEEKKAWNKKNHGFVVRTLANILQR